MPRARGGLVVVGMQNGQIYDQKDETVFAAIIR